MKSPCITKISWGQMEVEGLGSGRDFKLYPGGGRAWNWKETNTHHIPGVQIADVEELLEHNAEVIVLSRGMLLKLQMCPETLNYLDKNGIEIHTLETKMAVELYNHLAKQGIKVGGLFHTTC